MKRRSLIAATAVAAAYALTAGTAFAQSFPDRPVRIVVPYPPGASTDAISRAIASIASPILGQPIVVENIPGGGTVIATRTVLNDAADGYSVLFQSSALTANLSALKDPGYTLDELTPVAALSNTSYAMIIPSDLGPSTMEEFIAYSKENPGMYYGSLGLGTTAHVISYSLGQQAGIDWSPIPYKGTAETAQAVMSNEIQAYFPTQAFALQQINQPRLKILAVTGSERVDFLPDVPTLSELGYPIVESSPYAFYVKSETPPEIVEKLRAVFSEAIATDEYKDQLAKNGLSPNNSTFDEVIQGNMEMAEKRAEILKELGIEPK